MQINFQKAVKRPIPIDTIQLTSTLWDNIYNSSNHRISINGYTVQAGFITEEYLYPSSEEQSGVIPVPEERKVFFINTLEDVSVKQLHKAEINDWLIKGVVGEIYACANDIFMKTYELLQGGN